MTEVFIVRHGIWYLVNIANGVYNFGTGTHERVETTISAFRDLNDARSLHDALRASAAGAPQVPVD